jgi:methyl-accepting chemotaxis protein
MNEQSLLIAFIAVTSVAVVLQTLILAGMFFSTRKMGQRIEALSTKVEEQVLPLVEKVRGIVDESAPQIQTVITNLTETSNLVRAQAGQIDEAVSEIVSIARTQAGNAGELAERTMQRMDHAAEAVQHTVTSPMRHLSALMEGVMAGFGEFVGGRKVRRTTKAVPSDEMFI